MFALMKSRTKSSKNLVHALRASGFGLILIKLGQNVCLDEISDKFKFGLCGVKSSLRKILEKPFVRSRGHIFSPILGKRGLNDCLDEISDEFEIGSCWIKK